MIVASAATRPRGPARRRLSRTAVLFAGVLGLLTTFPLVFTASASSSTSTNSNAASEGQTVSDNYSPSSRTLNPVRVEGTSGSVSSPHNALKGEPTRISGTGSYVVFDFGEEVGGLVTLTFAQASSSGQQVGLAFSESSLYVGTSSDQSNGGGGADGAIYATVDGAGTYTMPVDKLRGGFRYLTVFTATSGWVDLTGVSLDFTAAPGVADPQAYANYFHSNDALLNKLWYAGAYTVQLDTIDPTQGRVWPAPASGWENDGVVGTGTSVLVDGAKRDRTVWPGDLGISLPTEFASTDDMASAKNTLTTLYQQELPTGELAFAGPEVNFYGSDTYHTWTLVGTSSYYAYSGDKAWLDAEWSRYKLAMGYILDKIDGNGVLDVTGTADWARNDQGGENIEANAILYGALTGGVQLAQAESDSADAAAWQQTAATLKTKINALLWSPTVGLYRDNPASTLYPQDGNSLAVWYGLTDSPTKSTDIVDALATRWNAYGAVTPEKANGGDIATFPGSMELEAHFAAGDDTDALVLMRREWGYMLNSPLGTDSTFWEGYKADGSFDYGGQYMSAAHGWATGPTSALTFYVLGLTPLGPDQYSFIPHPGDLTHVDGDITTALGKVDGSWDYSAAYGRFSEQLTSPAGSTGTIGVPTNGSTQVVVRVNGKTVWSGGAFTPTSGVSGGSTDGRYIYLTGVAPGSYSVTATGVATSTAFETSTLPSQLPPGYTLCATQGGTCTPNATQVMAFGAGTYLYTSVSGPTACATSSFNGSDPVPGTLKYCYLAPVGGPSGYTLCAAQGGSCSVAGIQEVAYGTNGAFRFQTATGSIACNAAGFGTDPAPAASKSCYIQNTNTPPGSWTQCASENGSCVVTGAQPLAFGANGAYTLATSNGTTSCSTGALGIDPIYGVVKGCYSWSGTPTGFSTACASENNTCAFDGPATVAYGADGDYLYKTFSDGVTCGNTAFGTDPLPQVAKSCYLVS